MRSRRHGISRVRPDLMSSSTSCKHVIELATPDVALHLLVTFVVIPTVQPRRQLGALFERKLFDGSLDFRKAHVRRSYHRSIALPSSGNPVDRLPAEKLSCDVSHWIVRRTRNRLELRSRRYNRHKIFRRRYFPSTVRENQVDRLPPARFEPSKDFRFATAEPFVRIAVHRGQMFRHRCTQPRAALLHIQMSVSSFGLPFTGRVLMKQESLAIECYEWIGVSRTGQ